uniref:Tfp pilus assembly protein, ATPase PilM n=1 Tax=Desulfovibrio sp. U5L TaxID=596152 RepID=I2Q4R7_9BACT
MAKESKPTPNQRLLELIRRPGPGAAAGERFVGSPAGSPNGKGAAKPFWGRFSLAKAVHVGVDISQGQLTCVKIRGQDAGFEVLGTAIAPVPEGVAPGGAEFVALLRRTLSDLCGPGPLPRIWAAAQSARANLQFVTIPKVPGRQVDNAVFWTAKKDMAFDEGAVIFDFERRGEVAEKGTTRIGAMAYTAPRDAVAVVRADFARAGFPLAGLTLEPFAHQNFFRRRIVPGTGGAAANLHVGQNWSRLEIFSNGNLMFMRVIKTSMSGMEQAVQEALETALAVSPPPPSDLGMSLAPGLDGAAVLDLDAFGTEDSGLVLELEPEPAAARSPAPAGPFDPADTPGLAGPAPAAGPAVTPAHAREVFESILYGCDHLDDCHPGQGLGPEEVMAMLEPVASRLVRQVEMTLKHYRESLGYEAVSHLTVSGLLGASRLFVAYIGEQAGLPCSPLDPMAGRVLESPAEGGQPIPGSVYTQALGLAFSDPDVTPNALFTYREKATVNASRRLEQWSVVSLAVVLAAMAIFSVSAASTRRTLARERDALAGELAALGGTSDMATLTRMSGELQDRRKALHAYAARNRAVGVWGEALALAPQGVGLGTLTAEFGPPVEPAKPAAAGAQPAKEAKGSARLVIEGMVTGDSRLFDSMLASYVVALENSPLFEDVSVKKSELEALDGGATGLRFVIGLSVPES